MFKSYIRPAFIHLQHCRYTVSNGVGKEIGVSVVNCNNGFTFQNIINRNFSSFKSIIVTRNACSSNFLPTHIKNASWLILGTSYGSKGGLLGTRYAAFSNRCGSTGVSFSTRSGSLGAAYNTGNRVWCLEPGVTGGSDGFLAMSRTLTTGVSQKDASFLRTGRMTRRRKTKESGSRDQIYYDVTAITSADEYNLEALRDAIIENKALALQSLPEDALDALHVVTRTPRAEESSEPGEVFLFREGSVVFWNVPKAEQEAILRLLTAYQLGTYDTDELKEEGIESLEFTYTGNRTSLISGDIHLHKPDDEMGASDRQLEMFAFSNAIALSVKLSIWESLLSTYVDSVEMVLQDLKDGKKIRLTEAEVLKKAGEIFLLSHLVNLSSDLLDTPDFYWDRNNVEKLFVKTCNYLSIARRVKVMNEKLSQCVNLTELLRDHLKDKHHTRLELMIIFLILIEVLYATFHLIERYWLEPMRGSASKSHDS